MKDKNKKTIFITGSGSGLGKSAAIALAKRGHKVIASVHYNQQIDDMLEIKEKEQLNMEVIKFDITDSQDRNKILEYDIDVLINNAALADSGSVAEVDINRVEKVFDTNVYSSICLTQLALINMIKKKKGRVIFISSLVGRVSLPFLAPYCISKFAIESLASCLRNEMKILNKIQKINIQVGIIEPGAYATGFNRDSNSKKYAWMEKDSYFKENLEDIKKIEKKIWDFTELKNYDSIIKKYIKAVEDRKVKHRYYAPLYQAVGIQILRIFGQ